MYQYRDVDLYKRAQTETGDGTGFTYTDWTKSSSLIFYHQDRNDMDGVTDPLDMSWS